MAQNLPNKSFRIVGGGVARRAVSYTPANDMTLRQFSTAARRIRNPLPYKGDYTLVSIDEIEWEIRSKDAAGHYPDNSSDGLLASGEFDWRYKTAWKLFRTIKHTINLSDPLDLTSGTEYYFIIKTPSDTENCLYPLGWADTYDEGDASEVDASVYCSYYDADVGSWAAGDNSYNLTLYILDEQAGSKWHVIVDGDGYMQPDNLRGYSAEQAQSGLAQSRGGQSEYSQLRYPYSNLSQDSWIGGSGQVTMEDMSSFFNTVAMDTVVRGQAFLGPKNHLTGIETNNIEYVSDSIVARAFPDTEHDYPASGAANYVAQKFTPGANITATNIGVRVNRRAWQYRHDVQIAIFDESGGDPDSNLTGWKDLDANLKMDWQDATCNQALTSGTDYFIVVKVDQAWGALSEYRLMFDDDGSAPGGNADWSRDGSAWTDYSGASMLFRVNHGEAGAMDGTVVDIVYGKVNDSEDLFALAGQEVYKWSEADEHWDAMTASLAADGTDMVVYDNKLYVAQGLSNNLKYYDGAWNSADYAAKYLFVGKGFYWASTDVSEVKYSNDGTTEGSLDPAAGISIGTSLYDITNFELFQGYLLVFKENGIWEIDDQDLARNYVDFTSKAAPDNGKACTVWSGMLFFNVQTTVWRWQGSQYQDVGPTNRRAGPGEDWPNEITTFTSVADKLLATASPTVDFGWNGLMAYNRMGWHHLTTGTRPNQTSNAIYVTTEVGTDEMRVWFGEGDRITYVKYPTYTPNRWDWPNADYDLTYGTLITSWWDGGLKDALKFWNRVTLIADIPDETYIEVYVAKDGEEWQNSNDMISIGELSNDQLEETGEYTLMFPDGMVAKSIQLVFLFKTDDDSKTARLKAYNIESLVRQQPVYVYQFRVLLANNVTNMLGETVSRTAEDMWNELQRKAATNEPIVVSFPGKSIRGMISHLGEQTMRFSDSGTDNETWERSASVSLIEAT